ncbi:MAG: HEAT repeat domain-containing protein, partial [Pseudomonadota bacterium]
MDREQIAALLDVIEVDDGVIRHIDSLGQKARLHLVELATDLETDEAIRARALFVLGLLGWRPAFRPVRALLDDESRVVRIAAMRCLALVGGPNAADPLIETLTDDQNGPVEIGHALDGIGRVGDEGTLEWLQTWLDQQTDFDRRKLVCKAIADIER